MKVRTPIILEHEPAGIIAKAGDAVEGFAEGEKVGVNPMPSCGSCNYCSIGSLSKELTLMTVTHHTRVDLTKLIEIVGTGKIDSDLGTVKVLIG